jgi:hypothetical protein
VAELGNYALWDSWIETVLRDSYLPSVQSGFTHQQLLDVAYENFIRTMAPLVTAMRTSLLRESYDITLVAGQATYDIPEHAMLNRIEVGYLLDDDDRPQRLERLEPTQHTLFFRPDSGHPTRITIHDKQIELNPPPSSADITPYPTLRTWIWRRPGRFVRASDDGSGNNPARGARVTSSAAGTVTYTTTMPSSFDASSEHDFYSQTHPHRRLATAVAATGAPSTSSQTFATATAALVVAGDYVCLKNETVFMPVPVDMGGHIKDLVIRSLGKTQADKDAYALSQAALQEDIKILFPVAADPMPGNPPAITLLNNPFLRIRRGRSMVRD